jgi:PAS domain S-box-containing protein
MMAEIRDDTGPGILAPISNIDDRFRVIFDAINDGIFLVDPNTGEITEVNRRGSEMFGYDQLELLGCSVRILSSGVEPYTQAQAMERFARDASDGKPQVFEWQGRTKQGAVFWIELAISSTKIGQIPIIITLVRDIDARKRLDEKLRLALLRASEASMAKSAFLANMSHELRTPLNAILGFSDLMLTQLLGPLGNPRYREYLGDIHSSGMQLLALIDDLLDLSRVDAGQANLIEQDVSLRHVIADACRMVELQANQSNVDVVITLPSDLPDIRGDERRIKQIVLNLLTNAIKFTPEAGTVTVSAETSVSGLRLEVRDTGIGIAKADLPKVLERFGQIDNKLSRKHKGTGLGLPLVKELIELHGGSLNIESEVGVGTAVSVEFPVRRILKASSSQAA